MTDIWSERGKLEKERRDAMKGLMHDFDHNYYYPKLKKLRELCAEQHGDHNFRFSDFGPIGHAWYRCSRCGEAKVENP